MICLVVALFSCSLVGLDGWNLALFILAGFELLIEVSA